MLRWQRPQAWRLVSTEGSSQSLKPQSPGVGAEWAPCQTGEGTQGPRGLEGFAEVDEQVTRTL